MLSGLRSSTTLTSCVQAWSACFTANEAFGEAPNTYWSWTNYMDVTCRNGNGVYGADRVPCTWYQVMSESAAAS